MFYAILAGMSRFRVIYIVAALFLSVLWFFAFAHSPWVGQSFLHNPFFTEYPWLLALTVGTGLIMSRLLRNWFAQSTGRWQMLRNAVAVPFGGGLVFCYLLVWSGARGDISSAFRHGNLFDLVSGLLLLPLVGFGTVACRLIMLNGLFVLPLAVLTCYTMGRLLKSRASR